MKNYEHKGDDRRDGYAAAEKYGGSSFKKKSFGDRDGGRGGFGGGKRFGGSKGGSYSSDRGERGGFGGGKSFGGDRGPATMHKATCDECKKECEVPFRPTGDKPIYCKNCFDAKRTGGGRDSYERGDKGSDSRMNYASEIESLKSQINNLNAKMEEVLKSISDK